MAEEFAIVEVPEALDAATAEVEAAEERFDAAPAAVAAGGGTTSLAAPVAGSTDSRPGMSEKETDDAGGARAGWRGCAPAPFRAAAGAAAAAAAAAAAEEAALPLLAMVAAEDGPVRRACCRT